MPQISVTINGKTYRMACDEGQENHLLELAKKFDGYVGHLKGSFGEIGDQRLTIMAGIMVIDELAELRRKVSVLEAENEKINTVRDDLLANRADLNQTMAKSLERATARIEVLSRKLNGLGD